MALLLNDAHPLTPEQAVQVAALLGETPAVRDLSVQVERACPLAEAAHELADAVNLRPEEW
ncbi:MAG TPA: CRISPR-associated protein Csx15 [Roseiflexaceae bacterium]|nr:CRISPR-associated protein Csx15 [Roseiflexaceae bacterium]